MSISHGEEEMAQAILQYLATHPQATDTADGIAQWWAARQHESVSAATIARALGGLQDRGLIEEVDAGTRQFYRLKRRRP